MTTGQRIAQMRKELGLSQEMLGEKLEVSRQAISKWESDRGLPEIDKLVAMSRLFGVSVGWLLGTEETPAAAETDASPPPELTAQQLQMVEEIAGRYAAAQSKAPEKRKRSPWLRLGCVLLCVGAVFYIIIQNQRLRQLEDRYTTLQNSISNINSNMGNQLHAMSNRVEEILESQNKLVADYSCTVKSADLTADTVTFALSATPRTWREGMTATFMAVSGDGQTEAVGVLQQRSQSFAAELTCPLTDDITLSVVFDTDGVKETQLLHREGWLRTGSFPDLWGNAMGAWGETAVNGKLQLEGINIDAHSSSEAMQLGDSPKAVIEMLQAGVFHNDVPVLWVDMYDAKAAARGENGDGSPEEVEAEGHTHWEAELPQYTLDVAERDTVTFAVFATDQYGRRFSRICDRFVLEQCDRGLELEMTDYDGTLADYGLE